jgi:hypothetical protein
MVSRCDKRRLMAARLSANKGATRPSVRVDRFVWQLVQFGQESDRHKNF